jgi:hypothetical protein
MDRMHRALAVAAVVIALAVVVGCGGGGGGGTSGKPTLRDSAGVATSSFSPGDAVLASFAGLRAGKQYDVWVRDSLGREVAYLRLTPTGDGKIPDTVLAYDVASGEYTVTVEEVSPGLSATPQAAQEYTFAVAATATHATATIQDQTSEARAAFANGEDVYVRGQGFPANAEVHVYVVADQREWQLGTGLEDLSGFTPNLPPPDWPGRSSAVAPQGLRGQPETAVTDANGTFAAVRVWSNVQAPQGDAFDVVVDVDRDGTFSAGDVAMDHQNVGFVTHGSGVGPSQAGDWRTNLACDEQCVYTDFYDADSDVYVYVNPDVRMQLGGDKWVKKYICLHRTDWTSGTALVDVSGPGDISQWEADTPRSGCTNEGRVLVWPATLTAGDYDVVIDVNRNDIYDPGVDIIDGGLPGQPGFTVGQVTPKKWTVLVYLDADDLVGAGVADLAEMEAVGSSDDVNIVVQHDEPAGAQRYYIRPGTRDVVADLGDINTGTVSTLSEFLSWGAHRYPADHYMVVIWNHGNGFADTRSVSPSDVCWDDNPTSSVLTVPQVRQALSSVGQSIDVLGYDACLMGMWEVAREMEGLCDYLVYSEEVVPGQGWPYTTILQRLRDNPDLSAGSLAQPIPGEYIATCGAGDCTMSCVDMSRMGSLDSAMDAWALEMIAQMDAAATGLQTAIAAADTYHYLYTDYRDLYGYAEAVQGTVSEGQIPARAQAVMDAVTSAVISHAESGSHAGRSHGMSVWLPNAQYFNNNAVKYGNLMAARSTNWDEFLATLWGMTLRVELTWGGTPSDLDSHLFDAQSSPNHLYYANKVIPGASLDVDDVTSYGPENVSVTTFAPGPRGRYDYAVYLYAGSVPQDAPAVVRVFRGGATVPERTFQSSGFSYSTRWWNVFNIDPTTRQITVVDQMQSVAPASVGNARSMPRKH